MKKKKNKSEVPCFGIGYIAIIPQSLTIEKIKELDALLLDQLPDFVEI